MLSNPNSLARPKTMISPEIYRNPHRPQVKKTYRVSPIGHKIAGFKPITQDTSILNELKNMMGNTKIQLQDNIKEL